MLALGNILHAGERENDAEALYREALGTSRRVLGWLHPLALCATNNLGCLLLSTGSLAEAEECLRDGLDGSRLVYGEGHVEALISSSNLSDALLRRHGDDAEGEAASLLDEVWDTLAHARGDPRVSYILHDAMHDGRVSYVVDGLAEHVATPRPSIALPPRRPAAGASEEEELLDVPQDLASAPAPTSAPVPEELAPPPPPPPPPEPMPDGFGGWAFDVSLQKIGERLEVGAVIETLPLKAAASSAEMDTLSEVHLALVLAMGANSVEGRKYVQVRVMMPSADDDGVYELNHVEAPVMAAMSKIWNVKTEGNWLPPDNTQFLRTAGAGVLPPRPYDPTAGLTDAFVPKSTIPEQNAAAAGREAGDETAHHAPPLPAPPIPPPGMPGGALATAVGMGFPGLSWLNRPKAPEGMAASAETAGGEPDGGDDLEMDEDEGEDEGDEDEERVDVVTEDQAATMIEAHMRGAAARRQAPGLVMKHPIRRKKAQQKGPGNKMEKKKKRKARKNKGPRKGAKAGPPDEAHAARTIAVGLGHAVRRRKKRKGAAATKIAAVALGRLVRRTKAPMEGFRWPQPQLTAAVGRAAGVGRRGKVQAPDTKLMHLRDSPVKKLTLPPKQGQLSSRSTHSGESIASRMSRRRLERAEQRSSRAGTSPTKPN